VLTMHILDLIDEREWVDIIKQRYERRLLEIFP
jgi:multicomponent K+:H+ antiporter subunit E